MNSVKRYRLYALTALLFCLGLGGSVSLAASQATPAEKPDDHPMAPSFTLFGQRYDLPCPLSDFAENGWELTDHYTDPESPNLLYGELTRSEGVLVVYLLNDTGKPEIQLSEASVGGISQKTQLTVQKGLVLPGGIGIGIREVEFRRLVPKLFQQQPSLPATGVDPALEDTLYRIYDYQTGYGTILEIRFAQSEAGWRTASTLDFHLG